MNIIDTINKSDPNTNMDLYVYLLNGMINLSKFIEKIFTTTLFENKELSTTYKQYKNGKSILKIHFYKLYNTEMFYFSSERV